VEIIPFRIYKTGRSTGRYAPRPTAGADTLRTMVSDEELKAHVERVERERAVSGPELAGRIDEMESTARCVHNELARRIERVDESSADDAALADLADRLDGIESRLDEIEARLD
jgi:uncharacterized protein (UPF0335 family)